MRRNLVRYLSLLACTATFATLDTRPGLTQSTATGSGRGTASGTLTANGKTHKLAHSAIYIDVKDESRPTVLVLSDVPPPDQLLDGRVSITFAQTVAETPFSGLVFRMNERGLIMTIDYFDKDEPTDASGLVELKLTSPFGRSLVGSVVATAKAAERKPPMQVNVTFNAAMK